MVILTEISKESSSTFSTSGHSYDVFLSFRGIDTRYSFTDHLHKALLDANIITFLDNDEIQTGEDLKPELESAIKASRVSIVVLSKNYASSTWCLDELVLILERRKTAEHIVIPIFYHVEPTDVRKQQNSFGDAMAEHKHKMDEETDQKKKTARARKIEQWQKALVEVADLKGTNASGWHETRFIEEIVRDISSRLDQHLQPIIPHLIGMDSSIDTITSWLKDGSSHNADILSIWGMGGIGKTSLAHYIYRQHYSEFARSSFIEDIERKCTPQVSSLLELQKQLLEDIQKGNLQNLKDVNVCTIKIEKALLRNRMLIVLDGVDRFEQLDVLIGLKGFHPGSKIIITTKDGSLTEKCGLFSMNVLPKHTKHLLEGLHEFHSLQLLSWHAFRCIDPKDGYKEESMKIVKHCGGHPLALKVLGSSLRNEEVVVWEDTVELLEKEVNPDIQKVLQISIDSLPSENDKELFKHIACFFVGKDKEFTETVLKECGVRTTSGFKKLIDRCLIMVGRRNELIMHQLLQHIGRDLVDKESPEKPWKRSRLWRQEESYNVLKQEKGTCKIQGLVLDMQMMEKDTSHGTSSSSEKIFVDDLSNKFGAHHLLQQVCIFFSKIWCLVAWIFILRSSDSSKCHIKTNVLSKMDKLRLLQLNYVPLQGSYKHFPKGLRWLSLHGFPLSYIPQDLHMDNMVALDMSNSNLQQLLKNPTLYPSLKILNLSSSKIVKMGDFSSFPALERLILVGCSSLIEVSESIGQCNKLVLLDLSYCNKLKKLPRSMKSLKKVRILSIDGCVNLDEFPSEIKDMESLEALSASDMNINSQASSCAVVDMVPRSVKSISLLFPASLVSLSLRNNNLFNESFPMDFGSLSKLKVLNISRNPITSLPDCLTKLDALQFLCLEGCQQLKSVSFLPCTIEFVDANECPVLEKITFQSHDIRHWRYRMINFISSKSLTEIEGIRKLQPLARVDEKMLHYLGWSDLELVKHQEVQVFDALAWDTRKKLPVQMFYEVGVFSISFLGSTIPNWFIRRSNGPSITFTVPSSPNKLRGLNMAYVNTDPSPRHYWYDEICNRTKKQIYRYEPYFHPAYESHDEVSIVCIRHWMIDDNEMEEGDMITISMAKRGMITISMAEPENNNVKVSECGISFVYDDGNKDEDPSAIYKFPGTFYKEHSINYPSYPPDYSECRTYYGHFRSPPPDQFELVTSHKFSQYTPYMS